MKKTEGPQRVAYGVSSGIRLSPLFHFFHFIQLSIICICTYLTLRSACSCLSMLVGDVRDRFSAFPKKDYVIDM